MFSIPQAVLVFGFELRPDQNYPWGKQMFREWFAAACGVDSKTFTDARDYWGAVGDVLADSPVRVVPYGVGEDRRELLVATEAFVVTFGSTPRTVKPRAFSLKWQKAWREEMEQFCKEYQIPFEEPRLLLCARGNSS